MADDLSARIVEALDGSGQLAIVLECIAATPAGLRLTWANRSWGSLFGLALGAPPPFLDPAGNQAALTDALHVAREGAGMVRAELAAPGGGGAVLTLGVQFVPLPGAENPRLLMIGRDVTDARRRAATDAATQWLLAQVFRCVDAGVLITRAGGRIAMTNPRLLALLDRRAGELDGQLLDAIVHPDDLAALVAARGQADPAPQEVTLRLATGGGDWLATRHRVQRVEHAEQVFRIGTVHPVGPPAAVGAPVMVAGKLQLIGLEAVRDAMGDRWPALAERAMAMAERVLTRSLGADESFARTADGGFVVCLASAAGPEEAAFRAAILAREIRRKLLGEAGEEPRLAAVSALTEPQALSAEEAGAGAGALAARLERRLAAVRVDAEARARAALRAAVEDGHCERVPVFGAEGAAVPLELVDLDAATRRALATALAVLPVAETEAIDPTALRLGLAAELILTAQTADAVLLPIEYEALANRGRSDRTLAQLRELAAARSRLVPLLTEIPGSASKLRVGDMLRLLRGFGRAVGIELDEVDEPGFDPSQKLATLAVVAAPRLTALHRRAPQTLPQAARRLQAAGVRLLALGAEAGEARELGRAGVGLHTRA